MKLSPDNIVNLISSAIQEDRIEIRIAREKIYNICTFITVSAYAVTSFLLKSKDIFETSINWQFIFIIEFSFPLFMWIIFYRLKKDLEFGHKCLETRQELLEKIQKEESGIFNPFTVINLKDKPTIREDELYWVAGVASFALSMKLIAVFYFF